MHENDLPDDWHALLSDEFQQPYWLDLKKFLHEEKTSNQIVYPPEHLIFNAFHQTPFNDVRVVIIGQDPYHGEGQAMGLSFSVPEGVKLPPSLRNIYKELARDYGCATPTSGDLTHWAKQGVLLLNDTLTVRAGLAGSHQKWGWEKFTDAVIQRLNDHHEHLVFLLWGSHAHKKGAIIDRTKHKVLETTHPSPLSAHRGFLGSGCFREVDDAFMHNKVEWM